MSQRWTATALVLGVLLIAVGHAQQPSTQADPPPAPDTSQDVPLVPDQTGETSDVDLDAPIFRSGVNFIRVDAMATDDDGNPVLDLTQDDFEIYEDGVKQEIESFELIQVDQAPILAGTPITSVGNQRSDQERAASQADVRVFVIFLDDYHVRLGNSIRARRMLIEFLENNLIPTDLVGVMFPLMPLEAVRLTRNHEAVINAVQSFEGVKYRYDVRNTYEAIYNHYPTEVVERVRNDVSLSALKGLMIYLGSMREGRKSVLLVSEGYSNYVPPQMRAMNATNGVDPSINPARMDPLAGAFDGYEETQAFFAQDEIISDLRRVFRTATRFNTSIYSLDPRGLAAQEFDVSDPTVTIRVNQRQLNRTQDTLRILAEETDGRAIVNQNDFGPGLQQMLTDSNAYYLLGYTTPSVETDGEFHEIDVRVSRPDVNLRARKGYWAITELDIERSKRNVLEEPPREVDVALGILSQQRRGQLVRTWVGTAPAASGKTRITFIWEPVIERGRRTPPASRVLLTAMGDTGGAYFRGRAPDDQTAARGTTRRGADDGPPPVTRVEFEADPGTMQLSLAIEGEAGEVLDRDRFEVPVPDYTAPDIVFSTPAFVRARNALEFRSLVEDWATPPTASRSFRRTDHLLLRFEATAPGDGTPDVEARLLNRSGELMVPLTMRPAADGNPYQVELAPSFLAPGEYVIELRAETPTSEATQLVAFRLGA